MRKSSSVILAIALVMASATATASRTEKGDIERCEAGLNRNVAVCNNTLQIGSNRWETCLDTAIMIHTTCMVDAVRRMQTRGED